MNKNWPMPSRQHDEWDKTHKSAGTWYSCFVSDSCAEMMEWGTTSIWHEHADHAGLQWDDGATKSMQLFHLVSFPGALTSVLLSLILRCLGWALALSIPHSDCPSFWVATSKHFQLKWGELLFLGAAAHINVIFTKRSLTITAENVKSVKQSTVLWEYSEFPAVYMVFVIIAQYLYAKTTSLSVFYPSSVSVSVHMVKSRIIWEAEKNQHYHWPKYIIPKGQIHRLRI